MNVPLQSIADVKAFFRYVIVDCDVNFHPDDELASYINVNTGAPTFTNQQVVQLTERLSECFAVCALEGQDIYSICLDVLKQQVAEMQVR